MKNKSLPTSALARMAILAKAGAKMAASEVGALAADKFSEAKKIQQTKILVEALSRLKGSAMKVGQLLSLEAQDLLPPEAIEILAQLQRNAAPIDSQVLFAHAIKDLGTERFNELNLTQSPIASASIGQVYQGRLKTEQELAVKIQFPNVKETITSDVKVLKQIAAIASLALGKNIDFYSLAKEIETVFLHETNYTREAKMMAAYSSALQNDHRFIVPKPFFEFCSPHVLTMTYETGVHLRDWIDTRPSQANRDLMAKGIVELYISEFYQNGLVQTDPNLANFLVRADTNQLVLLDCGAILEYTKAFVEDYKNLVKVILKSDEPEIISYCESKGYLSPKEDEKVKRMFVDMLLTSIEPFLAEKQPFAFTDKEYSGRVRKVVWNFSKSSKYSGPPKELIFLHRKLGGVFNLLKILEAKIDLRPYWENAMSLDFNDDRGTL